MSGLGTDSLFHVKLALAVSIMATVGKTVGASSTGPYKTKSAPTATAAAAAAAMQGTTAWLPIFFFKPRHMATALWTPPPTGNPISSLIRCMALRAWPRVPRSMTQVSTMILVIPACWTRGRSSRTAVTRPPK